MKFSTKESDYEIEGLDKRNQTKYAGIENPQHKFEITKTKARDPKSRVFVGAGESMMGEGASITGDEVKTTGNRIELYDRKKLRFRSEEITSFI